MRPDLSDFEVELDTWNILDVTPSHGFKGKEQFLVFRVTFNHFGLHHLFIHLRQTKTNTKYSCRSDKTNISYMSKSFLEPILIG